MDELAGKSIKWTFADGPVPNSTFVHTFGEDGSVMWRVEGGSEKAATGHEKQYAAVKVGETALGVSYLAASGYTLTVVLNMDNGQMVGFASNNKEWYPLKGTFEFIT